MSLLPGPMKHSLSIIFFLEHFLILHFDQICTFRTQSWSLKRALNISYNYVGFATRTIELESSRMYEVVYVIFEYAWSPKIRAESLIFVDFSQSWGRGVVSESIFSQSWICVLNFCKLKRRWEGVRYFLVIEPKISVSVHSTRGGSYRGSHSYVNFFGMRGEH